ncbi:phosphotransferase [Nocardioidaceae bacterium SCSIO 66511]|nr:phosphotransferase [Nocardioidaceae bacterium SCSIO 66511]
MEVDRRDRLVAAASGVAGRRLGLIGRLGGGEHALTLLARCDEGTEYVVRLFPEGDGAVAEEVRVLARLRPLGDLAPRLVAYDEHSQIGPIIVTSKVDGGHPPSALSTTGMAQEMAAALARIHRLDGSGLRFAPTEPPRGAGPAAQAARAQWERLARDDLVLTHFDFWCGNALWDGAALTGVVDWSGARHGARGIDVAWCRQDLVLLGSPAAADVFLSTYERAAGVRIHDVLEWDIQAGAQAEAVVETWAPNYRGIGRPEITAEVLRTRLDDWIARLLDRGCL